MKKAYRMFKRKNRPNYFIQNNATREQRCLGTSDKDEAQRLLDAANQARQSSALNMQIGKTYITHADPMRAGNFRLDLLGNSGRITIEIGIRAASPSSGANLHKSLVTTTAFSGRNQIRHHPALDFNRSKPRARREARQLAAPERGAESPGCDSPDWSESASGGPGNAL